MIWPLFRGQGRNQKYVFGSNENKKICFRNKLTFRALLDCHCQGRQRAKKKRRAYQSMWYHPLRPLLPPHRPHPHQFDQDHLRPFKEIFFKFLKWLFFKFLSKGQLISECILGVLNFPKTQRKIWQISALETKKWSNQQSM